MQAFSNQATGRSDIAVVDHQSFVDAGTTLMATGTENLTNSLEKFIRKLFVEGRPYKGKFSLTNNSVDAFNERYAKVHFYTKYNEASGSFNTDLYINFADGYDNGTNGGASAPSMWVQDMPKTIETFWGNMTTWQKRMTIYEVQWQNAFNDEGTFIAFINGYVQNILNELETYIENRNRALVAGRIAGIKFLVDNGVLGPECSVDMTKVFQDETNTTYDRDTILKEHLTEFLEIFLSKFKIDSDRLEEYSAQYHDNKMITENGIDYYVLSHTPKANQRMFYTKEIFDKARARVMPEIFGPDFIPANQGEAVSFWQSNKEGSRYSIKAVPAIPKDSGLTASEVDLDYVLALIFDDKALAHVTKLDRVDTSPLEAAKLYRNQIWHFADSDYSDYMFNSIMYYMSEYGNNEKKDTFTGDGSEVSFVLSDEATEILSVTVDGTAVADTDYSYDSATKTITFDTAPASGKAIVIDYLVA